MEKELVEFFEAAKKAADAAASESADGGAEESRCLDALQQLKNFPVTYQLLVSTQVTFFPLLYYIYIVSLIYFFYRLLQIICKTNGIWDLGFFFLFFLVIWVPVNLEALVE